MVEIRTELQGVMPASEMLTASIPRDGEQGQLRSLILASTERLEALIEDWRRFLSDGPAEIDGLLGAIDLLMSTPLTPEQRELATIIRYCSARLRTLIRQHTTAPSPGIEPPLAG